MQRQQQAAQNRNRQAGRSSSTRSSSWWPSVIGVAVIACVVGAYYLHHVGDIPVNVRSLASLFNSKVASSMDSGNRKATIIVVGGGLAGLSAAIEAERAGARVILLDKEARLGGNSAKASSGMNAVHTTAQEQSHINDSEQTFIEDTLSSGAGLCNRELVELLAKESTAAAEFIQSFGVQLDLLSQCGGHQFPRTHRMSVGADGKAKNVGWEITNALIKYVNSAGDRIQVMPNAKVTELVYDQQDARVKGVKYLNQTQAQSEPITLLADAVVLTTGGYGADKQGLLTEYVPNLAKLPTTNGPFAKGEGVKMVRAIGGCLALMDQVQIHPTSFVDPSNPKAGTNFLAPEALRGSGAILVNKEGNRFVNELGLRDHVTQHIFQHCSSEVEDGPVVAYMILNEKAVQLYGAGALGFYKSKGFIQEFPNAPALAQFVGVNADNLVSTLKSYNEYAKQRQDPFGKKVFPVDNIDPEEKLYLIRITPAIHYTMGGVCIDRDAHALHQSSDGVQPIRGLYAAGEVTGGLHGANRLAGNSLLECVVYGRRAGKHAAIESRKNS